MSVNNDNEVLKIIYKTLIHIYIKFYFRFENFQGFLLLGFTPCKAKQPLRGMELQEKEAQND